MEHWHNLLATACTSQAYSSLTWPDVTAVGVALLFMGFVAWLLLR